MSDPVEVYWMIGCSSCLRMKEFVEKSGVPYTAYEVTQDPVAMEKVRRLKAEVPCTVVGDEWALGLDLGAVAKLIGIPYEAPDILPTDQLLEKYRIVIDTLQRLIRQARPEILDFKEPERDRTLINLAYHAASVMRTFLYAYDPERLAPGDVYLMEHFPHLPPECSTAEDIVARAQETLELAESWWREYGFDDPLDRVEHCYWGNRTLLEMFEREVWHSAQHTRQVAFYLEHAGISPDRPLGPTELAGLPVPERVFG